MATELVETPTGLAVAGTLGDVENDRKTFVVQLDEQLDVVCVGVLGKLDTLRVASPPGGSRRSSWFR